MKWEIVMNNDYLRIDIQSKQGDIEYESDSSPKSWEHYNRNYQNKYRLYSDFDFDNLEFAQWDDKTKSYINAPDINSDNNRLCAFATNGTLFDANPHVFRIGGETDWNFKQDSYWRKNKFGKLNNLVTDSNIKERLEGCKVMHHTLLNFSIMPATGNMQGVKSEGYGDWLDRFDSFVSIIDDYYQGENEIILSKAGWNRKSLIKYLTYFEDVYDYFEQHYFINDKDFIKRLVESGKKNIENQNDVERYVSLAEDYWELKEKYIMNL